MDKFDTLKDLLDCGDIDRLLAACTDWFGADLAALNFVEGGQLHTVAHRGLATQKQSAFGTPCLEVVSQEHGLAVVELSADPRFNKLPAVIEAPGLTTYIGTPIYDDKGACVASLCVLHCEQLAVPDNWAPMMVGAAALLEAWLENTLDETAGEMDEHWHAALNKLCAEASNIARRRQLRAAAAEAGQGGWLLGVGRRCLGSWQGLRRAARRPHHHGPATPGALLAMEPGLRKAA